MSEQSPEQPPVTPEELDEAKLTIQAFVGDKAAEDRLRAEQTAAAHRQIQEALEAKRQRDGQ